ncbi:hypothetical protein FS749_007774 [Ceratobasidium sp. UAMH 11750]|nr:hypothetical protein FS749_007774 [Ceratobasidium sp. UAMH 11750]
MNIIKWEKTDAPSVRPRPEGFSDRPNPDAHGYVDWMELQTPSSDTYDEWCSEVGEHIAKACYGARRPSTYYMDGFPEGYALYIHHKTSRGKQDRHDAYLYGARDGIKFRSPNEFLLHAQWLMEGAEPNKCECKYCTGGRSQIDINAKYGLPGLKYHPERRHRHQS